MAGLLDYFDDPNTVGLLSMGAGLLNASGPSRMPVSLGQVLGQGMQSGLAGYQQVQQLQQQRALQQQQIDSQRMENLLRKAQTDKALHDYAKQQQIDDLAPQFYRAPQSAASVALGQGAQAGNVGPTLSNEARMATAQAEPGGFDMPGYMQALSKIDPIKAMQMQADARKANQLTLKEGDKVVDTANGQTLFSNAKPLDLKWIDAGNEMIGVHPETGQPVQRMPKNMSPDASARLQFDQGQANKPQYHDGAWVTPDGGFSKTPLYAPPKGSPEALAASSSKVLPLLDQADKLLQNSTGSYGGRGLDYLARGFGFSTEGDKAAAQLKALEGQIMMAQPRMEGPQSDKDTALYRQMAGQIGDPTVPVDVRRAALDVVRQLHQRYAGMQTGEAIPQQTVQPSAAPAAPKPLQVVDGYIFLGGNPSDPSRWRKQR